MFSSSKSILYLGLYVQMKLTVNRTGFDLNNQLRHNYKKFPNYGGNWKDIFIFHYKVEDTVERRIYVTKEGINKEWQGFCSLQRNILQLPGSVWRNCSISTTAQDTWKLQETVAFLQQRRIPEGCKGCASNNIYCSWMIGQLVLDHSRNKCCTNWTTIRWRQQAHPKRSYLTPTGLRHLFEELVPHWGIFPCTPKSETDTFYSVFLNRNLVLIFNLSHSPLISPTPHLPLLDFTTLIMFFEA
jgi:hypothetical protein